jgi:D-threo-aldose 1-dehydrogenase
VKRNRVGRSDAFVTELGFGGAPVGNLYASVPDDVAIATVRHAWDKGIRYFDTAPHYGLGLSESRIGAALRELPREEYVISTKVGRLLVPNPTPTGSDLAAGGFDVPDHLTRQYDYSRDGVRRSVEASLERMGLDHIDVAYVHDPENHMDQAVLEAIPALVELREQGVIRAIGAGMNLVAPLLRIVTEADIDVVMLAGRWTLADRSGEPLVATCEQRGVSVVAAAPFNSGLLASPAPPDDVRFDYAPASEQLLSFARRAADLCRAAGADLPQAALQFPLLHQSVASVVVGMASPRHVVTDVRWAATAMPSGLWSRLLALRAPVAPT